MATSNFEVAMEDGCVADAVVAAAPRHEDLSAIYQSLNESRQQMERLSGEVTQMNANLRMVLNQLMKTL